MIDASRGTASAPPSGSTTAVERAAVPGEVQRGRRGGRWPWLIVGIGLALVKSNAIAEVGHHPSELIAVLGVGLAVSVLRTRPVGFAVSAAPLLAFALAPRSTAVGVAVGLGAFVLLLALFVAIGTVLQARQVMIGPTPPERSAGKIHRTRDRVGFDVGWGDDRRRDRAHEVGCEALER
jgi:hypothetical protein